MPVFAVKHIVRHSLAFTLIAPLIVGCSSGNESSESTATGASTSVGSSSGGAGGAGGEGGGSSTSSSGSGGAGGSGEQLCMGVTLPKGMRCIAGGTFVDAAMGPNEEHVIATFALDTTEVTVGAYADCVTAAACTPIDSDAAFACNKDAAAKPDHPANCADWDQAAAYCAWAGKRLPTEWEWEWAARGRDEARVLPWGAEPPGNLACWFGTVKGNGTCPAGAYSPGGDSRDGVSDMAGNVWEWTDSSYELSSMYKILRGGCWNTGNGGTMLSELQADFRAPTLPGKRYDVIGFRCAMTP